MRSTWNTRAWSAKRQEPSMLVTASASGLLHGVGFLLDRFPLDFLVCVISSSMVDCGGASPEDFGASNPGRILFCAAVLE